MKAMRMIIDMLGSRNMKLHCCFVFFEEQPLDVIHLMPIRRSFMSTNAYVIPSVSGRCNNAQGLAIDRRWDRKDAAEVIASRSVVFKFQPPLPERLKFAKQAH